MEVQKNGLPIMTIFVKDFFTRLFILNNFLNNL